MKIVHTSSNEAGSPRPTRRYYSPQLKAEVIQECRQGSASVAGVALAHGINANIVHRWLHEDERAALLLVDALKTAMFQSAVLHADETPVAMLKPGNKKTHRAYPPWVKIQSAGWVNFQSAPTHHPLTVRFATNALKLQNFHNGDTRQARSTNFEHTAGQWTRHL